MTRGRNYSAQRYAEKLELDQKKADAGLVSELFPRVSSMVIRMTYRQDFANPILMVRTINVLPSSYAYFHMKCMTKDCREGGFDLTQTITSLVRQHKRIGRGKIACGGEGDKLASNHASISYEISINYHNR
jgi:hypothetical protein